MSTRTALGFIVLWGILHAGAVALGIAPTSPAHLVDPDNYMRLVRVDLLLDTGHWYDNVIPRSNAPFGEVLHWTRPLDVLIIMLAAPLDLFLPQDTALFWGGALVSPLLHLAAIFAIGWAVRPILPRPATHLVMLAYALAPAAYFISVVGRVDHHTLQQLLVILALGYTLRALVPRHPSSAATSGATAPALAAGAVAALAIWVSVETMIIVAPLALALAVAWWRHGAERLAANLAFAAAFLAGTTAALLLERPPHDLTTVEYDRISLVHLGVAAALLAVWLAVTASSRRPLPGRPYHQRTALLGACGLAGLAVLVFAFPGLIRSPFADLDPRIQTVFFDRVSELQPLLPTGTESAGAFLLLLGAALLGVPFLLMHAWAQRHRPVAIAWGLIAVLGLGLFLLSLQHLRHTNLAVVPLAIGTGALIYHARSWSRPRVQPELRSYYLALVLIVGLPFLGIFVSAGSQGAAAAADPNPLPSHCDVATLATSLTDPTQLGDHDRLILASIFDGPAILYHSHHAVVAGPYHRNDTGILFTYDALTGMSDDDAHAALLTRGVDTVLLCPSNAEESFFDRPGSPDTLYHRLRQGDHPAWLEPIPLHSDAAHPPLAYAVLP